MVISLQWLKLNKIIFFNLVCFNPRSHLITHAHKSHILITANYFYFQSLTIIPASIPPPYFLPSGALINIGTTGDHTMFRQGASGIEFSQPRHVQFSGTVKTEQTDTRPAPWPSMAGRKTTQPAAIQRLWWEIPRPALWGSSSRQALSRPWVTAPETSAVIPGAPRWEPLPPRSEEEEGITSKGLDPVPAAMSSRKSLFPPFPLTVPHSN